MIDLVFKMLLDNKEFQKNLKLSTLQIKLFKEVGNSVVGTLSKIAGAAGIAVGAFASFDALIHSSETSADAFDSTMRQCSTAVTAFFQALSYNGDFSAFDEGLRGLIDRAKQAYDALDDLENVMISFDRKSSQNQTEFDELYNDVIELKQKKKQAKTQKEKDLIQSQIDVKIATMNDLLSDQESRVNEVSKLSLAAIRALIREKNPHLKDEDLTQDFYREVLDLKTAPEWRQNLIKNYGDMAEEKRNEIINQNTTYQKQNPLTPNGAVIYTSTIDWDKVNELFGAWIDSRKHKREFLLGIAALVMYEKENTDKLKEITLIDRQEEGAKQTVNRMHRQLNRANAKDTSTGGGGHTTPKPGKYDDIPADLNTIVGVQKMIAADQEKLNTASAEEAQILAGEIEWLQKYKKLYESGKLTEENKQKYLEAYKKGELVSFPDSTDENGSPVGSIDFYRQQITENNKMINSVTDKGLIQALMEQNKQFQKNIDDMMGIKPEITIAPYIDSDESTLARLRRERQELIQKLNQTSDPNERIKIEAEIEENKKKTKKEEAKKDAENYVKSYSSTLANADFSSKEGRQAVARETINSIKALIIAKALESVMELPFPANIIAAPVAAGAMAGLFSLIPAFSTGGIFEGASSIGDMNIARVNSGEMILNNRQQRNLFNLLNNGNGGSGSVSQSVEFKIKGKDLQGVLNNYNSKINKIR